MSWDREGQYVTANHMGMMISGTVTHSRVKYGGAKIQHQIMLDEAIMVNGELREMILVETSIYEKGVEHTLNLGHQ